MVKGITKEKGIAEKEHEAAIQEGKLTSLVQYVTDDGAFTILIAF